MKKENILISIDPSSKSTGYAIFKNEILIDYGVIQELSSNILERINNIDLKIEQIINKYKPTDLAIENVQITMSAPTAKALLGLQLLLELKAYKHNIQYSLIRPTHWRKVLGLSNSKNMKKEDKKREAIQYVKNKYKISTDINDITDAICIGECYIKEKGGKYERP